MESNDGSNVTELTQESKRNEFISTDRLNDYERVMQNEVNNEEVPHTTKPSNSSATLKNSISSTMRYSNDLSRDPNNINIIETFKKPTILIGTKRPCSTHQILKTPTSTDTISISSLESDDRYSNRDIKSEKHLQDPLFPYIEPPWGGVPKDNYKMEVLKSGVIVEIISLDTQSFYAIGRLPSCHLSLAHPTISRYHAILQYRSKEDKENHKGFYVYDLNSTHGTFWNGNRIKPNVYVRIQGGHMLRFGCSQRKYILQAPPEDEEEESKYTLTELKEIRVSQLEKRRMEVEDEISTENKESEGIDWGMGEDADEETDLQENPYASITDEDLVLEDPKKTLRGWFEREGYDLRYQTEEKGFGQFLCWVDLPTDDIVGQSMRAEVLVKGRKKEAVLQCALEACKILDKCGLLRQANHEARKRKTRNWEAEDYYDSDEDNFLDRTGSVEKKREQRMRLVGKLEEKVETYDTLLEKHKEVTKRISHLSTSIKNWQNANSANKETTEEDALDAFMSSLSSFAFTKSDIAKMKLELQNLRKKEAGLIKLLNLAQPANLPALSSRNLTNQTGHQAKITEASSETKKIHGTLFHRKKEKQINQQTITNTKLLLSNSFVDTAGETEPIEEVDSDDNDELSSNSLHISLRKDGSKSEFESESEHSASATVTNKDKSVKKDNWHEIQITKKRRQGQQKIHCDQDVYADNYSMWVPPQNQAGDGKTSLNEKYGY